MAEHRPTHDPFAPPRSGVGRDDAPHPRGMRAGGAWIERGFRMASASPGPWIAITFVYLVLQVAFTAVPLVGSLASSLLGPVLQAGILLGCAGQQRTGAMSFRALFAGFEHPLLGRLVALGAVSLGMWLLVFIAIFMLIAVLFGAALLGVDGAAADALANGDPEALADLFAVFAGSAAGLLVVTTVAGALTFLATAAMWLATARVVFAGASITDALADSLTACLRAWPALLLYVPCMLGLLLLACLPLFLGLFAFIPLYFASQYAAHQDMFDGHLAPIPPPRGP